MRGHLPWSLSCDPIMAHVQRRLMGKSGPSALLRKSMLGKTQCGGAASPQWRPHLGSRTHEKAVSDVVMGQLWEVQNLHGTLDTDAEN